MVVTKLNSKIIYHSPLCADAHDKDLQDIEWCFPPLEKWEGPNQWKSCSCHLCWPTKESSKKLFVLLTARLPTTLLTLTSLLKTEELQEMLYDV
jgi:hypothetical protein